ncbi:MAG: sigma 54-interacting transcriptional regulator [Myxococcales bacterium]|nr:sigma 54-interacting transcriptional regulator [Myxococcales bacterium]MCB9668523.1 sigma 54-interacting transcriptional regulator [Alphaproteobacteria bacterium]MCB9690764.1 sigma 54-interacting transcriptional regulator [Alphaproteobacteria bacterium]
MTRSETPAARPTLHPASQRLPTLKISLEDRPLFVHTLRPGRTIVGRSDRCDLALPADGISRVHCVVEQRPEGWWIADRSRHGIQVNGKPERRAPLVAGDVVRLGPYDIVFGEGGEDWLRSPTATTPLPAALHEELVEVGEEELTTVRAVLRCTAGPLEGQDIRLDRARMSIGGRGSSVVLPGDLPRAAVWVRVVRGRVMVEPGHTPVQLAGARVRDVTPALAGEEIRVGEHVFVVDTETRTETSSSLEAFGEMVGSSARMRHLFGVLHRMALHDAPVLVIGESGTGKELAARGLHDAGPRHDGPFIAVNCAAIADTLFESELFGHEKGAFTGATARQDGAFHHAHTGTLFLDEIGELKLDLQAKLLRTLESGEVKRVGSSKPDYPDVRLVAATNRNLADMVRQGTFREDLYFRLSVLPVRTPPLRERREDIALLARTLLARNHPGASLSDTAAEALTGYAWPGNVRELRNVLTRAVVLGGPRITPGQLAFNPWAFEGEPSSPASVAPTDEKASLEAALEAAGGNRTAAARRLGIPRSSLLYKLRKHGLM